MSVGGWARLGTTMLAILNLTREATLAALHDVLAALEEEMLEVLGAGEAHRSGQRRADKP